MTALANLQPSHSAASAETRSSDGETMPMSVSTEKTPQSGIVDRVCGLFQSNLKQNVRSVLDAAKAAESELRAQKRVPCFRPIVMEIAETHGLQRYSAFTRDISATGLGFVHWMPVEPQEVAIYVCLGHDEVVKCPVDITWSLPCGYGWYISGGRFKITE